MLEITTIPHVLAVLNTATFLLLLAGYSFVRNGDQARHKAVMIAALISSVVFLALYTYYHANSGLAKFGGEGVIRPVYFTILIAHVVGAMALTVMVPMIVVRAVKGSFDRHRALARVTLPLWLYVSLSGIVVYVMAIHLYPYGG